MRGLMLELLRYGQETISPSTYALECTGLVVCTVGAALGTQRTYLVFYPVTYYRYKEICMNPSYYH